MQAADPQSKKRNTPVQGRQPNPARGSQHSVFRAQRPQEYVPTVPAENRPAPSARRVTQDRLRVLHVGCGAKSSARLHPFFRAPQWEEIRFDIDEDTKPDIAGSIVDMRPWIETGSCDAILASHVLEHLSRHEVAPALSECRRILRETGFFFIRTPDLESVAQFIVDGRAAEVIYTSPAGPITPIDMLYGHGESIRRGFEAMRHGTAFTEDLLAQDLLDAGFAELRLTRTDTHEIWALAFMPNADIQGILRDFAATGFDLREPSGV